MRPIADETQGVLNDEVLGGDTARSLRAADRFAGLPMAQAALEFASARHASQYREIDHAPFIAHPIEVGRLLRDDGQPDELIAAGLLHDVLEKTAATSAELQSRFGPRIARLVESISDNPSIGDDEQRRRELRNRVAHADPDTCAIFAADKIAKVRELALLPARRLDETKARAKLAHYRASLEMLQRVAGELALVDLLATELNRFVAPRLSGLTAPQRSRAPRARKPTSTELPQSKPAVEDGSEHAAESEDHHAS
jgi:HD domain